MAQGMACVAGYIYTCSGYPFITQQASRLPGLAPPSSHARIAAALGPASHTQLPVAQKVGHPHCSRRAQQHGQKEARLCCQAQAVAGRCNREPGDLWSQGEQTQRADAHAPGCTSTCRHAPPPPLPLLLPPPPAAVTEQPFFSSTPPPRTPCRHRCGPASGGRRLARMQQRQQRRRRRDLCLPPSRAAF